MPNTHRVAGGPFSSSSRTARGTLARMAMLLNVSANDSTMPLSGPEREASTTVPAGAPRPSAAPQAPRQQSATGNGSGRSMKVDIDSTRSASTSRSMSSSRFR